MLKIALPNKGRLAEDARDLFEEAGLPVRTRGDRALSASLGYGGASVGSIPANSILVFTVTLVSIP